mmetsp:Transcript_8703/g.10973  ORF Transcript_8703/g.10973 Transcript_8703/m.10973 type:complete len:150 (+) Transcript_8703:74-523(+)|eukprot:CAMPEP_0194375826 /NCGR_PEP_ID=MMETSP0174-20130528/24380_1 /TAXON_ID=216777 /ORGANISM="Proboscia alata, Strain PI-D3" /LENGTH=149 /DNA_ID=CAMNT_0039156281 /DNA_START=70 /DNA_END=519 /DNA_ORIENTATION=+
MSKPSDRNAVLWSGQQIRYSTVGGQLMGTCCFCCPDDQVNYKLVGNKLRIIDIHKGGIGPNFLRSCQCCCGDTEETDNIDLTQVQDIDTKSAPAGCMVKTFCCASDVTELSINTRNDKNNKVLKLSKSAGKVAYTKINNQIENGQPMSR